MKPFFTDLETRKFTFKEKITCIFDQLYALLQSEETVRWETLYDCSSGKKRTIKRITCVVNENGIGFINEIELPFTGITVKVDQNGHIEIIGDAFCYTFPCIMMPQIWYRLKKAL